jgi:hypothetical protein
MHSVEANPARCGIRAVAGVSYGVPFRGDAEDAPSGRYELATRSATCPGVEDDDTGVPLRIFDAKDRLSGLILPGIPAGGEYDTHGCTGKARRRSGVEASPRSTVEEGYEIPFHPDNEGLRLWVAKSHIELDHPRCTRRIDHETHVEDTGIGATFRSHAPDHRMDDFLKDALFHRRGEDRCRRVRPHSARILTPVPVESALVVLRRSKRSDASPVTDGVVRRLLPQETLFDQDASSSPAEAPLVHDLGNGTLGLLGDVAHENALPCRESIGLHDTGPFVSAHVRTGSLGVVEDFEARGRDAVARHEVLGEGFAALELRRFSRRTKDRKSPLAQAIGNACGKGRLRSYDDKVDRLTLAKVAEGRGILARSLGKAARNKCHAVASRRCENPLDPRAPRDLPGKRVLAPAGAHDEDPHEWTSSRRISAGSGARP